jgi:predicted nucleotidyltransferase
MQTLQQAFAHLPYVETALLFGSRAGTDSSAQSDYDFAVLMDKSEPAAWGHLALVRTELGETLNLADEDFDVVDLEIATPEMLKSIESHYRILKGDERVVRSLFGKHRQNR